MRAANFIWCREVIRNTLLIGWLRWTTKSKPQHKDKKQFIRSCVTCVTLNSQGLCGVDTANKGQDPTPTSPHPGLKQGHLNFMSHQPPFTPSTHSWKQPNSTKSPGPPKEWENATVKLAPPTRSPLNHDALRVGNYLEKHIGRLQLIQNRGVGLEVHVAQHLPGTVWSRHCK